MSVQLKNSRVLLTGATGGIGRAIAAAMHARGARLLLSDLDPDVLEGLRSELGERAEAVAADLTSSDDLARLVEGAGEVDVLVANAGLPATGRIESFSREEIDRALDLNLRASIQLAREFVSGMLERRRGHIVMMSSMAGKVALPFAAVYSATKFGIRGFGLALREDLRGTGVGVTVVSPGPVGGSGMFAVSGAKPPRGVGMRSPEQVADAVGVGIEKDKPEMTVASHLTQAGGRLFGAAPPLAAAANRRLGLNEMSRELADSQRDLR